MSLEETLRQIVREEIHAALVGLPLITQDSKSTPTPVVMPEIIRLKDVSTRIGLGRSTIYRRMKERTFPPSIDLGAGSVGWKQAEVEAWIDGRRDWQ